MTGPLKLRGTHLGMTIERKHTSLDDAIEAAYGAVASRSMTPESIVDADGTVVMSKDGLADAMWRHWGETEY